MRTIRPITDEEIAILRAEDCMTIEYLGQFYLLPVRIVERITIHPHDGCWRVKGWGTGKGHANMKIRGKTRKVHRVVFTLLVGPIPEDKPILDHKRDADCAYKDCCNPFHLEPVTNEVNTIRGDAPLYRRNHEYV